MIWDSADRDSVQKRPLPKWLTDQKEGLTKTQTHQPARVMKEDHSLEISMAVTGLFILLAVVFLSFFIVRRFKNKSL